MLSPSDAAVVRRDPTLPGLATVLDPEAFGAVLRHSLPEAALGTAQITYLKYKPGTSCLVGYRLDLAGAGVEVHATAYRAETRDKLRKARVRPSLPGPLGPGQIVLQDGAILVSVFPNDSELKALPRLGNEEDRTCLLQRLAPDRPDLWTGTLRTLRYKPKRRYVAQVLTLDGAQVVLKAYTESGYQAARRGATLKTRAPLRIARRLGQSKRYRIVAFEWLPGRLLSEALAEPQPELATVAAVGAALATLHAQESTRLGCRIREDEAAHLLAVAGGLGFLCPHLARRAGALAQRLVARLGDEPSPDRPTHGDFYADQVLLAGDTVAILDLDEAVRGDPAADLGLFIAHLERDVLREGLSPSCLQSIRQALLEGYRMHRRHLDPVRVNLYTAAGLFRLAPEPFRYREPDWSEWTETILQRAEAILAAAADLT